MNMKELKGNYMRLKKLSILSLAAGICLGAFLKELPAQSKTAIKDEGQAKLMQQVNAAQKSHQLTPKEANKLRKDLSRVARKKAKMLAKSGRKLTAEDATELKGDVDNISDKKHKLELEKSAPPR
jgi:hypothetical protein